MDEQINEKLEALLKYIPFIDFIVNTDKEKYFKFIDIKKWIINKKRYPLSDLNKIEKSIITQYKNLIAIEDKKIPREIIEIFIKEFKHQYVDLCSDDEDNAKENNSTSENAEVLIESDDDLEIVSISYPEKQKSKSPDIKLLKENARNGGLDAVSVELLKHIDQLSNEDSKNGLADPHIYHENSDDEDNKKFQRRRSRTTAEKSKYSPNTVVDTISLDSSDEETTHCLKNNRQNNSLSAQNYITNVGTNETTRSPSEVLNNDIYENPAPINNSKNIMDVDMSEKFNLNEVLEKVKHLTKPAKNSNSTVITSRNSSELIPENPTLVKNSKNMDVEMNAGCILNEVFEEVNPLTKCTKDSNSTVIIRNEHKNYTSPKSMDIDGLENSDDLLKNEEVLMQNLEKLFLPLLRKLLQTPSTELVQTEVVEKSTTNENINQVSATASTTTQFSPTINQPMFYGSLTLQQQQPVHQHPFGCQHSLSSIHETPFVPIQTMIPQPRVNLNDPRIRNWLNIHKNSPLLTTSERNITASLGNLPTQNYNSSDTFIRSARMDQYLLNTIPLQYTHTKDMSQSQVQNHNMSSRQAIQTNNSGILSKPNRLTYGEYKRRKADEQQRSERQQEDERKRRESYLQQKTHTNLEIVDNIQKKTDEIRSILRSTVQPYTGKIEDACNLRPATSHDITNMKPINGNDTGKSKSALEKEGEILKSDRITNKSKRKDASIQVNIEDDTWKNSKRQQVESKKSIQDKGTSTKPKKDKKVKSNLVLNGMDCDQVQNYIPKPIAGKRRSSINARSAIASQLNAESQQEDLFDTLKSLCSQSTNQCSKTSKSKQRRNIDDKPNNLPRKRLSSASEQYQNMQNTSSPRSPKSIERNSIHEEPYHVPAICERMNTQTDVDINKQNTPSSRRSCTSKRRKTIDGLPRISSSNSNFETNVENLMLAKMQPTIVLKRITDDEINTHSKNHAKTNSNNILNVHLVATTEHPDVNSAVTKKRSPVNKKVTPKILNIDCQMTQENTRICVLCSSRPSNITNHYIQKHKSESYISRLTSSQLDELSINTPFAKVMPAGVHNRGLRCSITCHFCGEMLEESFMNLYNHYSTHTGEYAFQCSGCQLQKPFRADIQSHQLHAKTCRNAHLKTLYRYPSNTMVIYLHYCNICNFVQLNEANILRHLRNHHDQHQANPINVQKCILAAITDGPDDNNEPPQQTNQSNSDQNQRNPCDEKSEIEENSLDDIKVDISGSGLNVIDNEGPYDSTMHHLEEELKKMHEELPMTVVHVNQTCGNRDSATTPPRIESKHFPKMCKSEAIDIEDNCLITPPRPSLQTIASQSSAKSIYRSYPINVNYLGLYKCMAGDCYYSTDSANEMLTHLNAHASENMLLEYMICAYCNIAEDVCMSSQQLVDHIQRRHLHMIYQCSMCCYRSCEASNVTLHQKHNHPYSYQACKIYKCSGPERSYDAKYIHKKISNNISKIQCLYCSDKSYYHSKLLECHMKTEHKMLIPGGLNNYSCIYCPLTDAESSAIRKHLALEHPDKLPYFCDHNNPVQENEDFLHYLKFTNLSQPVPIVVANETLDTVAEKTPNDHIEDIKPSLDDLLKSQEDTLKIRLRKLTEKTGVAPDILYQCPENFCRGFFSTYDLWLRHMRVKHHCLECQCPHCPSTKSLTDFKDHFEGHRRHTYACFHCSVTFANCEDAKKHASIDHVAFGPMRLEQIRFNLSYSYFILIQNEILIARSELIPALLNSLNRSLKEREYNESKNVKCSWLVRSHFTPCLEDVNNISNDMFFICGACCNHHYSRQHLSNHIRNEHATRDVPIMNVIRSNDGSYFSFAVVFATECLSFSTMRNCFCCGEVDMRGDAFILHLKRYHEFVLTYFCEWCNLPLESLQSSDMHFKLVHSENKLKIRCEFASKSDISLVSVRHFRVNIQEADRRVASFVAVKQEPDDNPNNDDNVIILEEDDVVLESYMKEQEKIQRNSKKPKLTCIAVENLMAPATVNTSTSLVPTAHAFSRNARLLPRTKIVQRRQPNISLSFSASPSSANTCNGILSTELQNKNSFKIKNTLHIYEPTTITTCFPNSPAVLGTQTTATIDITHHAQKTLFVPSDINETTYSQNLVEASYVPCSTTTNVNTN